MKRLSSPLASLLALAVMFAIVPATRADNIAPGGVTTNLTPLPGDLPTGSALDTLSGPFKGFFGGNPTGSYVAQVFRNSNGGLDFTYDFNVTGGGVTAATMATFLPTLLGSIFRTDVFFLPGTGTVVPSSASRTAGTGDFLTFTYIPNTVNDGESSDTLVIATDAHQFNNQGILGLLGGDTASVRAFQPIGTPIPEPSSMLLFGTGLSTLGATLRRRMKKQEQL